jgi:hypothetical protein
MDESYTGGDALVQMRWMDRTVPVKSYKGGLPDITSQGLAAGRLDVIKSRGTLRGGYLADSLPFVFSNKNGEVVGFGRHRAASLEMGL